MNLKDIGRKVGHGTVVGTNAVLEADLTKPVTSVRSKVRQVKELHQAHKLAKDLNKQFGDVVNAETVVTFQNSLQLLAQGRRQVTEVSSS